MELVDLAVKRVNFGLSLPDGQVRFFVHPRATMDAKSLGTLNTIRLQLTPPPSPPPSHTHIPPLPPSNNAYCDLERDRIAITGIQTIVKVNLFAYLICYHCWRKVFDNCPRILRLHCRMELRSTRRECQRNKNSNKIYFNLPFQHKDYHVCWQYLFSSCV